MPTRNWCLTAVTAGCLAWSWLYGQVIEGQVVEEEATEVLKPMSAAGKQSSAPDLSESVKEVIRLTNAFREKEELTAVKVDPRLTNAAQKFSDFMARTDRFGHKADGTTPAERAKKAGYAYCIVAENIAYEFSSGEFSAEELATAFVDGWKASPGHRRNMLDEDVIETGVAIARGAKSGYFFAVQIFGRPKSKAMEFSIANESSATFEYKMGDRKLTLAPRQTRTHEVCRRRDMAFGWRDAGDEVQSVEPHDGDHFAVTGDDDVRLRKE